MNINIKGSFIALISTVSLYGIYKFSQLINLLFNGSVAYTAQSGTIKIPKTINTTLNSTVASISTGYASFNTVDAFLIGLIPLSFLITLFWPVLAQWMPGNKKKKKGSNGGGSGGFMNA